MLRLNQRLVKWYDSGHHYLHQEPLVIVFKLQHHDTPYKDETLRVPTVHCQIIVACNSKCTADPGPLTTTSQIDPSAPRIPSNPWIRLLVSQRIFRSVNTPEATFGWEMICHGWFQNGDKKTHNQPVEIHQPMGCNYSLLKFCHQIQFQESVGLQTCCKSWDVNRWAWFTWFHQKTTKDPKSSSVLRPNAAFQNNAPRSSWWPSDPAEWSKVTSQPVDIVWFVWNLAYLDM